MTTILCTLVLNAWSMSIFRFISEIAVGVASSLSPMYLAEISPNESRSASINKNAIFIVLGQLCAFTVNAALGNIWGWWDPIWRIMLLSAAVPGIILWINSYKISNSPQWLLFNNHSNKARQLFYKLRFSNVPQLLATHVEQVASSKESNFKWSTLINPKGVVYLLFTGIVIALVQQISGVNTIMYYGTILLEKVGLGESGPLYANILIGIVSVIASILGTRLIEKSNHHHMLYIGLFGNAVFLCLLGFIMKISTLPQDLVNILVLVCLALFLADHQGLVSPVTWLLLAEMFPGRVKAQFMSIASTTNWITNFLISLVYPQLITSLGIAIVFFIFALANGISIILSILFFNNRRMKIAFQGADN
ncbi:MULTISPECIES: MFS transporter [Lactobacillaceae]|uniref:MFS transporter n=1 Tax=Lactobacillaceae TaxID=33958 RepID=UPI001F4CA63A|nr:MULTISPECIES: MFS transporter [Lactobacillaceae]MCH8632430.1 MFS transporter [Lactiplantibacillus plantarum]MCH8635476.1 MFS transporter [Lactiplantibacillus plantarum]